MKTNIVFTVILTSLLIFTGCSSDTDNASDDPYVQEEEETTPSLRTEVFSFTSNGNATNAKIYLPDSYETNANLPAIYLIDFTEQHFAIATDEFEKVVDAVKQTTGLDALVVTLQQHLDIDSQPEDFQDYYAIFKDMASYVDSEYTNNTSRTFIARGSEAGIVIMTLFLENPETSVFDNFIATDSPVSFNSEIIELIESGDFPQDKGNKKLHFSFSASNNFSSCTNMINKINEAEYTWLQFESIEYTSSYTTTYPTAFSAGLNYIFNE